MAASTIPILLQHTLILSIVFLFTIIALKSTISSFRKLKRSMTNPQKTTTRQQERFQSRLDREQAGRRAQVSQMEEELKSLRAMQSQVTVQLHQLKTLAASLDANKKES